jgi:hypothetical protein
MMVSLAQNAKTASPGTPAAAANVADDRDPGYTELLWQRRRDIAKLCILSLVVLLAISMHSAAWHYLREYIETAARLSYWQEVALRGAYPVAVLFVLWHVKSFLV